MSLSLLDAPVVLKTKTWYGAKLLVQEHKGTTCKDIILP